MNIFPIQQLKGMEMFALFMSGYTQRQVEDVISWGWYCTWFLQSSIDHPLGFKWHPLEGAGRYIFKFGAVKTPNLLVEVAEPLAWIVGKASLLLNFKFIEEEFLVKCGEQNVDFFVKSKEVES